MIAGSSAFGSPTIDQCRASIARSAKYSTHSGVRFMSIRIFTSTRVVLQTHQNARLHMRAPRKYLPVQDMGTAEECPLGSDPKRPARPRFPPSHEYLGCRAFRP